MNLAWILLIVLLVLVVFGGLPRWGYHNFGPYPSSIGVILLIILIVLVLTGRL